VDVGSFYFIKDEYFTDYSDDKLMKNGEKDDKEHNRPCYYAFKDNKTPIYWLIPFSSQTDKFQRVYDKKVIKYGDCDTIHFGYVLGEKKAFLIQNMCPVVDEYINNQYIDSSTGNPVIIAPKTALEIERKAKKVLMLQRRGSILIFPNIFDIEKQLLAKLNQKT
jgi:hypothetical protein